MDESTGWIDPNAAPWQPLPEAEAMPSIEARDRVPLAWSRESLLQTAARSGFAPSFRQTRADLVPVYVEAPVQASRPAEPASSNVLLYVGGAVAVVAAAAIVYKLTRRRGA